MSFRIQSRAASSAAIQASDGVAVSIAIASRVRGSARTWTFVATGPTTLLIRSIQADPADCSANRARRPTRSAASRMIAANSASSWVASLIERWWR